MPLSDEEIRRYERLNEQSRKTDSDASRYLVWGVLAVISALITAVGVWVYVSAG
jgi:hypothetical protein